MQNILAAALGSALIFLASSALAENCVRAYGQTAEEAFGEGMKLAERADLEAKGHGWLDPYMQIRILPANSKGMFVAEVYSLRNGAACPQRSDSETAETLPKKESVSPI